MERVNLLKIENATGRDRTFAQNLNVRLLHFVNFFFSFRYVKTFSFFLVVVTGNVRPYAVYVLM